MIDKDALVAKREARSKALAEHAAKTQQLHQAMQARLDEMQAEGRRLEGEVRALDALIAELTTAKE